MSTIRKTLGILDLLGLFGYQISKKDKLVRHADQRISVPDLFRRGWLETYQAHQAKTVFANGTRIISFVGLDGTRSRFFGVFDVLEVLPASDAVLPDGCPQELVGHNAVYFYKLRRVPGFDALEDRVIIDWQGGTRTWHQYVHNKTTTKNMPVVEMLAPGTLLTPFIDYLDFTLTYRDLKYLCAHATSNHEWRSRLEAVAGIYLILDSQTGDQYVGSAGGTEGIWGRWSSYAQNGHGGNALLRKLIKEAAGAPETFTFSILQVVPRTTAKAELLQLEKRFKNKLGTRATGLNQN